MVICEEEALTVWYMKNVRYQIMEAYLYEPEVAYFSGC